MVESEWIEYKCKSGETIFIYNKVTAVHKWPPGYNDGLSEDRIIFGQPVQVKELHSIAIQTDNHGCDNGCTSMYINTDSLHEMVFQPQPEITFRLEKENCLYQENDCDKINDQGHCNTEIMIQSYARDNDVEHNLNSELNQENDFDNDNGGQDKCNTESTIQNDGDDKIGVDENGNDDDDNYDDVFKSDHNHENAIDNGNGQDKCNTESTIQNDANDNGDDDNEDDNDQDDGDEHVLNTEHNQESSPDNDIRHENHQTESTIFNDIVDDNSDDYYELNMYHKQDISEICSGQHEHKTKNTLNKESLISLSGNGDNGDETNGKKGQIIDGEAMNSQQAKGGFTCGICSKTFKRQSRLNCHLRAHIKEKPHECPHCQKKYTYSQCLEKHLRTHSIDCNIGQTIDRKAINSQRQEETLTCGICSKTFKRQSQLKCHLRAHKKEKPHECPHCQKKYTYSQCLERHLRTHSKDCNIGQTIDGNAINSQQQEETLTCGICSKTFKRQSQLKCHLKAHENDTKLECPHCQKKYIYSSSLESHLRTHSKDYRLDQQFDEEEMNSQQDQTKLNGNTFTQSSSKKFSKSNHLKKGVALRNREKMHSLPCLHCQRKFSLKGSLLKHLRLHLKPSGRKTCTQSSKKFSKKDHLKKCVAPRNKERSFKCYSCKKKFLKKAALEIHIRTHTGDRPYKCSFCPKKFNQGGSLLRHERIHTGERPFKCAGCHSTFTRRDNMMQHFQKHCKQKLF